MIAAGVRSGKPLRREFERPEDSRLGMWWTRLRPACVYGLYRGSQLGIRSQCLTCSAEPQMLRRQRRSRFPRTESAERLLAAGPEKSPTSTLRDHTTAKHSHCGSSATPGSGCSRHHRINRTNREAVRSRPRSTSIFRVPEDAALCLQCPRVENSKLCLGLRHDGFYAYVQMHGAHRQDALESRLVPAPVAMHRLAIPWPATPSRSHRTTAEALLVLRCAGPQSAPQWRRFQRVNALPPIP